MKAVGKVQQLFMQGKDNKSGRGYSNSDNDGTCPEIIKINLTDYMTSIGHLIKWVLRWKNSYF